MDYHLFRILHGLAGHSHLFDSVDAFWAKYSALVFPIALVVLWIAPGRDSHKVRTGVVVAAVAVALALGINQIANHLVGRPRPYMSHHVLHLLLGRVHDNSFPSDHTALAFAVVAGLWPVRRDVSIVLGVLAVLLGISRVVAGVHYPGDILGGAAIGVMSAIALWLLARRPLEWLASLGERLWSALLSPFRRRHLRRA